LGYLKAGEQQILWNGDDDSGNQVASGIYIYELKTSVYRQMKKMLLIR
jgi:flagellar hook assembly protein FlgD